MYWCFVYVCACVTTGASNFSAAYVQNQAKMRSLMPDNSECIFYIKVTRAILLRLAECSQMIITSTKISTELLQKSHNARYISHNASFCHRDVCTFLLQNGACEDICLMHCGMCEINLWCFWYNDDTNMRLGIMTNRSILFTVKRWLIHMQNQQS